MKLKLAHLKPLFCSLVLAITFVSCHTSIDFTEKKGNGTVVTQTRNLTSKFEKIEVESGIDLIVSQSENSSITVETDENIQALITTTVENGVLLIQSTEPYSITTKGPIVRVNLPIITGLKTSSGATATSGSTLKSTSLIVESSSGSEIQIDVETDFISLESSSGSEIKASGKALKVETASSSGSDINAGALMANDVFAQTSSGSSTSVYPILSLSAKASSGSDITYKNVPKKLKKAESSGGSVSAQ